MCSASNPAPPAATACSAPGPQRRGPQRRSPGAAVEARRRSPTRPRGPSPPSRRAARARPRPRARLVRRGPGRASRRRRSRAAARARRRAPRARGARSRTRSTGSVSASGSPPARPGGRARDSARRGRGTRGPVRPRRRPLDQARDVGEHQLALAVVDRPEDRLEGGERIVGDLRRRAREAREQRRLARVRQPDEAGVGEQLQPQLDPARLAGQAALGEPRRLAGRAREALVAVPAERRRAATIARWPGSTRS